MRGAPTTLDLRARMACAACAVVAAIALALHVRGGGGSFLGDDFSHVNAVYRAAERGQLWSWTLSLFHRPLGNASYAYRPLGFVSYALDWSAFGASATGWRITSLALLVANAAIAVVIVRRWLPHTPLRLAASLMAGASVLCFPFVGEVSYWLNGRFDLLACLFSLLYLATLTPSRSGRARPAWGVACVAAALWSKESALLLPLAAMLIVFARTLDTHDDARRAARMALRATAPGWLVFVLYLGLREVVLGSAWKVYLRTRPPHDVAEWWDRFASALYIVREAVGPSYLAWLAGVAIALGVLVVLQRKAVQGRAFTLIALLGVSLLYAVAPAFSFEISSPQGEGARHLYLPWVYASLAIGVACGARAAAWLPALALLLLALPAQSRNLAQWQAAGRTMHRVVNAVAAFAPAIPADRYALLLLPERVGPVWFANNAQGGIVMKPHQRSDALDRMAITTVDDLPQWNGPEARASIARYKGIEHFDAANLLGLYCWAPATDDLVRIAPGELVSDPVALRNARAAGCLV